MPFVCWGGNTASSSSGLSAGAVTGIVIGVAAAVALVGSAIGYKLWQMEKEKRLRRPLPVPEEFGPQASQMRYSRKVLIFQCSEMVVLLTLNTYGS